MEKANAKNKAYVQTGTNLNPTGINPTGTKYLATRAATVGPICISIPVSTDMDIKITLLSNTESDRYGDQDTNAIVTHAHARD